MILYFMDRAGTVIGSTSTNSDYGHYIIDDKKTEDVTVAAIVFDATLAFDDGYRTELEKLTKPGNYVLRHEDSDNTGVGYSIDGVSDFFIITEQEIDKGSRTIYIYCENGSLDLLNDIAAPYEASSQQTLSTYVNNALNGTTFTLRNVVGITNSLTLAFEESETVTSRLQNIASSFDCEMHFGFTVNGLTVTQKWVDFYKEYGRDTAELLMTNRELDNIVIKKNINNLATALYPTASDGSITLEGYVIPNGEDEDGDFFIDGVYLKTRKGLAEWYRFGDNLVQNGGYVYRSYSATEATDRDTLFTEAKKKLKEYRSSEVNYEVSIAILPEGVGIGDRLNVVDPEGNVYISGRILKLETSVCNDTREATIGDYLIKTAGLSDKVKQLSDNVKNQSDETKLNEQRISGTTTYLTKDSSENVHIVYKDSYDYYYFTSSGSKQTVNYTALLADDGYPVGTSGKEPQVSSEGGLENTISALSDDVIENKQEADAQLNSLSIALVAADQRITDNSLIAKNYVDITDNDGIIIYGDDDYHDTTLHLTSTDVRLEAEGQPVASMVNVDGHGELHADYSVQSNIIMKSAENSQQQQVGKMGWIAQSDGHLSLKVVS